MLPSTTILCFINYKPLLKPPTFIVRITTNIISSYPTPEWTYKMNFRPIWGRLVCLWWHSKTRFLLFWGRSHSRDYWGLAFRRSLGRPWGSRNHVRIAGGGCRRRLRLRFCPARGGSPRRPSFITGLKGELRTCGRLGRGIFSIGITVHRLFIIRVWASLLVFRRVAHPTCFWVAAPPAFSLNPQTYITKTPYKTSSYLFVFIPLNFLAASTDVLQNTTQYVVFISLATQNIW